MFVLWPQQVSR